MLIIDAGHGGKDPGAIGSILKEKNLNLNVAKELETFLLSRGVPCKMTRESDITTSLEDRVRFVNSMKAQYLISIHSNAAISTKANGIEVYVGKNDDKETRLAERVLNKLIETTGMTSRGVKKSSFYILKNTISTSILVELGFITNDKDQYKLTDQKFIIKSAEAIGNAFLEHIGYNQWKNKIMKSGLDRSWIDRIERLIELSEDPLDKYWPDFIEKI